MNPAIADAVEDDGGWGVDMDGHVDRDKGVELAGLCSGAREAVEDKGGIGVVGVIVFGVKGWRDVEVGGGVLACWLGRGGCCDGVESDGLGAVFGEEPAFRCKGVAD